MGSIEASSDSGEFEGRRMNKEQKNPDQNWLLKKRKKENYNIGQNLSARMLVFHPHLAVLSPKNCNSYKAINVLTLFYFCLHTSNQVL